MFKKFVLVGLLACGLMNRGRAAEPIPDSSLTVRKTTDFKVDGEGTASQLVLRAVVQYHRPERPQSAGTRQTTPDARQRSFTRTKAMYFLFDCTDQKRRRRSWRISAH